MYYSPPYTYVVQILRLIYIYIQIYMSVCK